MRRLSVIGQVRHLRIRRYVKLGKTILRCVEPEYLMSPFDQLQCMLAKLENMRKHAYIMSSLLVAGGVVPPEIATNQIRVPIHIQRLWLRISWPTYVILGIFYEYLLFCTFAIIISCKIINHHCLYADETFVNIIIHKAVFNKFSPGNGNGISCSPCVWVHMSMSDGFN